VFVVVIWVGSTYLRSRIELEKVPLYRIQHNLILDDFDKILEKSSDRKKNLPADRTGRNEAISEVFLKDAAEFRKLNEVAKQLKPPIRFRDLHKTLIELLETCEAESLNVSKVNKLKNKRLVLQALQQFEDAITAANNRLINEERKGKELSR